MTANAAFLKVPKRQGERAMHIVHRLMLAYKELRIERNETHLYIPLKAALDASSLRMLDTEKIIYDTGIRAFEKRTERLESFLEILRPQLPGSLGKSIPHSLDIVGDIAIVEIPPELTSQGETVGKAILNSNKSIHTVLAKAGAIDGKYRLRQFRFLAGEDKTLTTHREFGCQYQVDLSKAYFSPRLSYEHKRVSSQVKEGETVVDLFAGIGPFSILIAKTHENVRVYSVDVNPDAVKLLKINTRINCVMDKVTSLLGDAKQSVISGISGIADRIIMNLPESAVEFVSAACDILKTNGGTVHFYSFASRSNPLEKVKLDFTQAVEKSGRTVTETESTRVVRETAPHECQIVIDARVR